MKYRLLANILLKLRWQNMGEKQPSVSRLAHIAALTLFGFLAGPVFGECAPDAGTGLSLVKGGDEVASLTLEDLDRLPQQSFQTTTQWTEGTVEFSGPALADVLAHLEVSAAETPVRLVAANRYSVEMPAEIVTESTPIVATRRNGCPFGVRDLGPLWVVFPYDSDKKYRTEQIYSLSIWQLMAIEVEP